jgi:hypothetical protein
LAAERAGAERLGKGRSLLFLGIGGHTGQFVSVIPPLSAAGFPGVVLRDPSGEIGGEIAYERFVGDQTTLGASASFHAGNTRMENPGFTTMSRTHSFTVRIGGDRFAFIGDPVAVYVGPGVFYRRGRWRSQDGSTTIEGPDATEMGLSGRIGVYTHIKNAHGFWVQIGQNFSHTSGEAPEGKLSWWSGSPEGSLGLAIDF